MSDDDAPSPGAPVAASASGSGGSGPSPLAKAPLAPLAPLGRAPLAPLGKAPLAPLSAARSPSPATPPTAARSPSPAAPASPSAAAAVPPAAAGSATEASPPALCDTLSRLLEALPGADERSLAAHAAFVSELELAAPEVAALRGGGVFARAVSACALLVRALGAQRAGTGAAGAAAGYERFVEALAAVTGREDEQRGALAALASTFAARTGGFRAAALGALPSSSRGDGSDAALLAAALADDAARAAVTQASLASLRMLPAGEAQAMAACGAAGLSLPRLCAGEAPPLSLAGAAAVPAAHARGTGGGALARHLYATSFALACEGATEERLTGADEAALPWDELVDCAEALAKALSAGADSAGAGALYVDALYASLSRTLPAYEENSFRGPLLGGARLTKGLATLRVLAMAGWSGTPDPAGMQAAIADGKLDALVAELAGNLAHHNAPRVQLALAGGSRLLRAALKGCAEHAKQAESARNALEGMSRMLASARLALGPRAGKYVYTLDLSKVAEEVEGRLASGAWGGGWDLLAMALRADGVRTAAETPHGGGGGETTDGKPARGVLLLTPEQPTPQPKKEAAPAPPAAPAVQPEARMPEAPKPKTRPQPRAPKLRRDPLLLDLANASELAAVADVIMHSGFTTKAAGALARKPKTPAPVPAKPKATLKPYASPRPKAGKGESALVAMAATAQSKAQAAQKEATAAAKAAAAKAAKAAKTAEAAEVKPAEPALGAPRSAGYKPSPMPKTEAQEAKAPAKQAKARPASAEAKAGNDALAEPGKPPRPSSAKSLRKPAHGSPFRGASVPRSRVRPQPAQSPARASPAKTPLSVPTEAEGKKGGKKGGKAAKPTAARKLPLGAGDKAKAKAKKPKTAPKPKKAKKARVSVFLRLKKRIEGSVTPTAQDIFKKIDERGKGKITQAECGRLVRSLLKDATSGEAAYVTAMVATSSGKSGLRVTLKDFVDAVKGGATAVAAKGNATDNKFGGAVGRLQDAFYTVESSEASRLELLRTAASDDSSTLSTGSALSLAECATFVRLLLPAASVKDVRACAGAMDACGADDEGLVSIEEIEERLRPLSCRRRDEERAQAAIVAEAEAKRREAEDQAKAVLEAEEAERRRTAEEARQAELKKIEEEAALRRQLTEQEEARQVAAEAERAANRQQSEAEAAAAHTAEMERRAAAEADLEERQRVRAARDSDLARAAEWVSAPEDTRVSYLVDKATELSSSGRVMLYGRLKDGLERSGHVKKRQARQLEPGSKPGIKFVDLGQYATAMSEGPPTLPEPAAGTSTADGDKPAGDSSAEEQVKAEEEARREAFEKLRAEHVVAPVAVIDKPGLEAGYMYNRRTQTKQYSYYKYFGFAGRGARTSWAHAPTKKPAFADSPSPAFTIG